MNNTIEFETIEEAKLKLAIKTGLFIIDSNNNVSVCKNDDDPVIVQIGYADSKGVVIDSLLAEKADDIHEKLSKYFYHGLHDGITMLILSILDNSYSVYGDDTDNECEPIAIERRTVKGLLEDIEKLK